MANESLFAQSPFLRDCATGASVGITDIAAVYPLAVIATRRENGLPLISAIRQGRFWAGGWTDDFQGIYSAFLTKPSNDRQAGLLERCSFRIL